MQFRWAISNDSRKLVNIMILCNIVMESYTLSSVSGSRNAETFRAFCFSDALITANIKARLWTITITITITHYYYYHYLYYYYHYYQGGRGGYSTGIWVGGLSPLKTLFKTQKVSILLPCPRESAVISYPVHDWTWQAVFKTLKWYITLRFHAF